MKLLRLLLLSNVAYFLIGVLKAAIGGGIDEFFRSSFTAKAILKFVLLNVSPFAPHLWYIGANIYVLIIWHFAEKLGLKRVLLFATPILLLGDLLLGKYSKLVFGREFPYIISRNWIFVGIPYFAIGNVLHEKKTWISNHMNKLIALGCVFLFSITSLLERYLLVCHNLNATRDHYISTTFLALAVFLLFLYYAGNKDSFAARIGREDSTWIYVFHYMLIRILGFAAKQIGIEAFYNAFRPVIVFLLMVIIVEIGKKLIKKKA